MDYECIFVSALVRIRNTATNNSEDKSKLRHKSIVFSFTGGYCQFTRALVLTDTNLQEHELPVS